MTDPQYKPGDTMNGHILGDDGQWHPIAAAPAKKKPIYRRWWFIGGAGLAAIIFIISIGSGGSTDTAAAPSTDQSATGQDSGSDEPSTPGIGDPARDGKFEFVVTFVEAGVPSVGNDFLGETAQGAYTLVTLQVTNIGDEPQYFDDGNVKGFDSQGRELSSDGTAGLYANENNEGFLTEINPGNSVTAVVVFDLPQGETLTSIKAQDSLFSGGVEITLQ